MNEKDICLENIKLIICKRNPVLYKDILNKNIPMQISEEEKDKIKNELQNEFCESGLKSNDEPNEYGLLLEDMIDFISK